MRFFGYHIRNPCRFTGLPAFALPSCHISRFEEVRGPASYHSLAYPSLVNWGSDIHDLDGNVGMHLKHVSLHVCKLVARASQ